MQLRNFLPKNLLWRSTLLFLLPSFLFFVALNWFYYERHISEVNRKLAQGVGRDISTILAACENGVTSEEDALLSDLEIDFRCATAPGTHIPDNARDSYFYRETIEREVSAIVKKEAKIYLVPASSSMLVTLPVENGLQADFQLDKKRLLVANAHFQIVWGGLFLIALGFIAYAFMRQQVRSILHLSEAARAFGRGQDNFVIRQFGATEVRAAAEALKQMRDRLKSAADQRTTMLSGISHDLRTPLTRLKLTLAMMDETDDIKAAKKDLSDMHRMLDDYLEFARLNHEPVYTEFDLISLVRDMEIVKANGIKVEASSDKLAFTGNASMIQRAVENVISNAIKNATTVEITIAVSRRNVRIYIEDDGPGIPEDLREKVFQPFFRVDTARNQNIAGSGLGLSLARDTVASHGGNLKLDASPLGGLRAIITLPV